MVVIEIEISRVQGYCHPMGSVIYLASERGNRQWPKKLWREALGEIFRETRHERGAASC